MKNAILFILILFLFVSLIGVVSASQDTATDNITLTATSDDISENTLSSGDAENLEVNDNDVLSATHDLSGSTLQDIKDYFDNGNVQEGDTVYLGNLSYTSTWQTYENNFVEVNVPNVIISGGTSSNPDVFSTLNGNNARMFKITASGVVLNNLIFTNSYHWTEKGTAIIIGASDCTINNCIFDGCNNVAVYAQSSASNTMVTNCNFTENSGTSIHSESDCEVNYCNFTSNTGDNSVVIYSNGVIAVNYCNFTQNNGGIYSSGSRTEIKNSIFDNNAQGKANYQNVATVTSTNSLSIENCNFTSNTGAAISASSDAEISNSIVANHSSELTAVTITGSATLNNVNFTNNTRTGWNTGGALTISGDSSQIYNCNFENNSAGSGGAINVAGANTKIENCNFTDNTAFNEYGGAIYSSGSGLTVNECNFGVNSAQRYGDCIYSTSNGVISNSSFKGDCDLSVVGSNSHLVATLTADFGNAIYGDNLELDNLSYWDGESKTPVDLSEGSTFKLVNKNITVEIYDSNGDLVDNYTDLSDENGQISYDYSAIPFGDYTYKTYTYYEDAKIQKEGKLYTVVSGNRFSDIQAAIDAASDGETIYLKNVTYTNDIGSMVIDKSVSIIGTNGTVLDAEGKSRIFTINDNVNNVNLENIAFVNGNITDNNGGNGFGGAIYIGRNANNGVIKNSTFTDNTASLGGGAIYNQQCLNWIVDNCTFINNTAYGETDVVPNGGGAIWSCEALMNITNSTFKENEASYGGALRGAFDVYDSEFYSNTATDGNGGAIDVTCEASLRMTLTLEYINSTFVNNTAYGDRNAEHGGRAQGGALHMYDIQHVYMKDCQCYNNTADRGGAVDLYIISTIEVDNCIVENNTAHSEGGGFFINTTSSPSEFKNSIISNNNAGTDGGAIYLITDSALFDNITSVNNTASRGGSAFIRGHDAVIQNSTFNNNSAISNGGENSGIGGAFDILGNNCQLINVTSNYNNASLGGSIFIRGNSTKIRNSTFDGNNATLRGGGINVAGDDCVITDVDVSGNNASTDGGAIYIKGNDATITDITAIGNNASRGGAIFIEGDNADVHNGTLDNNNAFSNGTAGSGRGGAVDIAGEDAKVYDLDVSHNHADGEGGAIYVKTDGIDFHGITSINNTASLGGSSFINGSDIKVHNCTFDDNRASLRGGGLNIAGDNCTIWDVEVSGNNASTDGGAIYIKGNDASVRNVTADYNNASRGGAVFIEGDGADVHNCTLDNNRALFNGSNTSGRGGGLDIAGADCQIYDLEVSNNWADREGGAFYVKSSDIHFYDIISTNNTAQRGGSSFILGDNITVSDSRFNDNKALFNGTDGTGLGGAIDVLGNNCTFYNVTSINNTAYLGGSSFIRGNNTVIRNCTLDNNTAALRGGGLDIAGNDCKVSDVDVSGNRAGEDGGAIYVRGNNTIFDDVDSINNTAQRGGSSFIDGNNITVTNCDLNNNTASNRGGGLDVAGNDCKFINVTLSNCNATHEGGAVYVRGNNTLFDNVTSVNNTAEKGGSSFIDGKNNTVKNCKLDNNTASIRGGGLDVAGNDCKFINVTLSYCNATEDGGAVYVRGNNSMFDNVTSLHNTADRGGSSFIEGNNITVKNSKLDGNNASNRGGSLDVAGDNCTFVNVTFSNNNAENEGGAVYVRGDNAVFDNVTSTNNTATYGGSSYISGNNATVKNCNLSSNTASYSGGGISITGDNCTITNTTLSHCKATYYGGAVNVEGSNNVFDNVTSVNNTAANGGSSYILGNNVTVKNCTIANNTGLYGGGLNIAGWDGTFINNKIINNTAINSEETNPLYILSVISPEEYHFEGVGGGVYIQGSNNNFTNNNISSNTAENAGGGVYSLGNDVTFNKIYAYNNSAQNGGFAVIYRCENVTISNSTFDSNHATGDIFGEVYTRGEGGAIQISGSTNITVEGKFYNNTAMNGSAIYVENYGGVNSTVKVHDSVFLDNQARSYYLIISPDGETYHKGDKINISVALIGGDNIANAIHNHGDVSNVVLNNVTYPFKYANGTSAIKTTPNKDVTPVLGYANSENGNLVYQDDLENNQTIDYVVKNNDTDENVTVQSKLLSDISGSVYYIDLGTLEVGNYTIYAKHDADTYYTFIDNSGTFTVIDEDTAELKINKTVDKARVFVGDTVEFTINVTNIGESNATHIVVKDILPSQFEFNGTNNTNYSESDGIIIIDKLDSGKSFAFTIKAIALVNGTWNNTAYANCSENTTVISDNATVVVDPVVVLSVNKTVDVSHVKVGDSVVFTINVTNNGPSNATNVVIRDVVPVQFSVTDCNDTNYINNAIVVSRLNVKDSYVFTITATALVNGTWNNTAYANCSENETVVSDNATVVVDPVVVLSVNKTVNISYVKMGEKVIFTINVTNNGPSNATNVLIRDVVPAQFTVTACNDTDFKNNEIIVSALNVGESYIFTITAIASINGTWNNTAYANCSENTTLVNDTVYITVYNPNMTVEKVSLNASDFIIVNDIVSFNITVYNTGDCDLGSVTVTDLFSSDEFELKGFTANGWTNSGNVFTLDVLAKGANSTFTVWFKTLTNGTLVNNVTARSNLTDPVNDTENIRVYKPDMTAEKISLNMTNFTVVNNTVAFNITVKNTGDCDLHNVNVSEIFDENELTFVDYSKDKGWTLIENNVFTYGTLAKGADTTFTVYFTAKTNGALVNNITVKSGETDARNATANVTVYNPRLFAQKLRLNTTVYVGNNTYFMIVVKNTGDCDLANVTVYEQFNSTQFVYYNHTKQNIWVKTGDIFKYQGILEAGETQNFTIIFTTKVVGNVTNTIIVSSNRTDNKTVNNTTNVHGPELSVEKVSLNATDFVVVNNTVVFNITVRNTGDVDLGNVVVTDFFNSSELKYLRFAGDGWTNSSNVFTLDVLHTGENKTFTVWFKALTNGTLVNNVTATSNLTRLTNDTANITVYDPKLLVEKVSLNITDFVVVNNSVAFNITVRNTGDCDLGDVTVTDLFNSSEFELIGFDAEGWSNSGNVFTLDVLAKGANSTFTLWFKTLTNGTLVNNVSAESNATEKVNDTANITVYNPDLFVQKLRLNTTVYIGNNTYFMIVVKNTGDCELGDVKVYEKFSSDEFEYFNHTMQDVWHKNGDVFTYDGVLRSGETQNFTIIFKTLHSGNVTNTIVVSSNRTENKTVNNTTNVHDPKLDVEKVSLNATDFVVVNNTVAFNITVRNTGDVDLGNVVVTDFFNSSELRYLRFAGEDWTNSSNVFTLDVLHVGENKTFTVWFKALTNGILVNKVTAISNLTGEVNDTANVTVYDPKLSVEKVSLNITDFVVVNNSVAFNITVRNTGDCDLGDVTVTDFFNSSELELIGFTGESWTNRSNVFTLDVLAKGANSTLTVWFKALTNGTLINNVSAESNVTDTVNDTANITVYNPDLFAQKLRLNTTVYIGNNTYFMIVVKNTGDCELGDVKVYEKFSSDEFEYINHTMQDVWHKNGDVFTYDGVLRSGETQNFTIIFKTLSVGNVTNTIVVSSNRTENKTVNNTTNVHGPNLKVQKIAVTKTVYIGNQTVFAIIVKNTGDVDLSDVFVVEKSYTCLTYADYVNVTGKWTKTGDKFTLDGILGVNKTASFNVVFNTTSNGTFTNVVVAGSDLTENKTANNNTTVLSPDMTVEKVTVTKTVYLGNQTVFTVIVRNTGDCDLGDVFVSEKSFTGLSYVSYANVSGLWNKVGMRFNLVGVLAKGADASFNITFNTTQAGNLTNVIVAGSNVTENRTVNNNTTVYNPDMTVEKITVTKTVYLGNQTVFTVIVRNTGDCDLGDVFVSEKSYSGLTYAGYTNVTGQWTKTGDKFSLVGVLAKGANATFNIVFNTTANGTFTNVIVAGSNVTENRTANNNTTVYNPDMCVEKITVTKTVYLGNQTVFTVIVRNTGDCDLGDVFVSEKSFTGLSYVSYANVSGLWNKVGMRFNLVGVLAKGADASFNITFNTTRAGNLTNVIVAGSNVTENRTANNNTTVLSPDMTVEKVTLTKTVYIGNQTVFTITVKNTGDCDLGDVFVIEKSYNGLTFDSYTIVTGEWTKAGDKFTFKGILGVNESASFNVIFNTTEAGNFTNVVVAGSNVTENKTANNNTTVKDPICDLEIQKMVNASNVYVNDTVEWTIIVTNKGPCTAKDVIIKDYLPENTEIISPLDITLENNTIVWEIGDLKVNNPITIKIVTRVLAEGKIDNFVTVNSSTNESDKDNNKANNTTYVNPICDLIISKSVNASDVYLADTVEWNITVINVGPSSAENVKVQETLPEGLVILSATADKGSFNNTTKIWNIGDLNPNTPLSLILVTRVMCEGNITNIVHVNTTTEESDIENNIANNTTVANPVCDLIINKTVNASSVYVGDSVCWIVSVVNAGPSTAFDVKVTDAIPDGVVILSAKEDKGKFNNRTRVWEIGELKANCPVSLILVTEILAEGEITNIVNATTSTYEKNTTNNEAKNTTYANPICDLEIVKLVNASEVYLNDYVEWTVTVVNKGPSTACDVVVNESLPDSLKLIKATASVGEYADGIWNIGSLAVNTPVTLKLTTQTLKSGEILNTVTVNSTTPDRDSTDNIANNTTEVNPICDLEITKKVNATNVKVGELVEWTVTLTNKGPSTAEHVMVTEYLPNSLELVNESVDIFAFFAEITDFFNPFEFKVYQWALGSLEIGNSVTITLTTRVLSDGEITNIVTADSSTPDSNKTNNQANNTTVGEAVCDLEIIKLVSDKKSFVGEELTWTIIVKNHGPSTALDVKVSENIPKSLKYIKSSAGKGSYNAKTQVWTIGELAASAEVRLTIVTEVLSVGNITNPVEVTTSTYDNDTSNNRANNTTYAGEACDLELIKSSDKKSYKVGDKMHWTITVTNHGPSTARDVVVRDVLPEAVKFISFTATKGSYDAQSGKWDIGSLKDGESVTLDIYCKVLSEGIIVNFANVTTSTNDTDPDNNMDNASVEVKKIPENKTPEPEKHRAPVRMHETGNPIAYLILALFAVFIASWTNRKE